MLMFSSILCYTFSFLSCSGSSFTIITPSKGTAVSYGTWQATVVVHHSPCLQCLCLTPELGRGHLQTIPPTASTSPSSWPSSKGLFFLHIHYFYCFNHWLTLTSWKCISPTWQQRAFSTGISLAERSVYSKPLPCLFSVLTWTLSSKTSKPFTEYDER